MIFFERIVYKLRRYLTQRDTVTVRYAFPLVLATLGFLGASLILPTNASYIRLDASQETVFPGDEFFIKVLAGAHIPVNAIDVELSYSADQIEILSLDKGESVITLWTREPYFTDGKVFLQGGTYRKGFLGEHQIISIKVRALKAGKAKFTTSGVELLAGDGSGSSVKVNDSGYEDLVVTVGNNNGEIKTQLVVVITTDIDGNGDVGMNDIIIFMTAWSDRNKIFDFNDDGKMTFIDFAIILSDSFYK